VELRVAEVLRTKGQTNERTYIHNIVIYDVTHDNASYTVTLTTFVLTGKFGYQKQRRFNAFDSVQDIFINLSACLYLWGCPCYYLLFWFSGFYWYGRRDEQTNERIDTQLFL